MDMSAVIQPKSDQINADDLIGGAMTVTIDAVNISPRDDQPISIKLKGMAKVYRPCKSMARVMVQAWGADASKYAGRSLTLYRDPKVKWGGMEVGGIRISHMSHIESGMTLMLTETRANRRPFKIGVLQQAAGSSAPDNATDLARAAARKGKVAFTAWWNSDEGKTCRGPAGEIMDELKRLAADADATPGDDDDKPPM